MKAYMYPGQGSQARGMATELFARFPMFVAVADDILGFSVAKLCQDESGMQLNQTQFTQPVLYVVNALSHLQQLQSDEGRQPDFLLGHSLGEFNALQAAGCFDFEDGLRLVKRRGELFAGAPHGAMAAVVGTPLDALQAFLDGNGYDNIDIAGINTPSQIVVSGPADMIRRLIDQLSQDGGRAIQLNTSGAFHSRLMANAAAEFRNELTQFQLRPPMIPVISNVTARPHVAGEIANNLAAQIVSPVRWCQSVQMLLANGVQNFAEVGHGQTLTNMLQQIRNDTRAPMLVECTDGSSREASRSPAAATAEHSPDEMVREWNYSHKVGLQVTVRLLPGKILRTRTAAQMLFGHRAAVYLENYEGYFDLRDVAPADSKS